MRGAGPLTAEVAGGKPELLWLVSRVTALTVLTGGLYSFWSRTRVRRWLWSALRIGGAPLEYVGQPLEKLMGFVLAALIVATYLGLVVMVLVFLSLELTASPEAGALAAFALIPPLYWFAKYRGLRYLLNHTRWRGIGFSMAPGAWGYVLRATFWTGLAVATLGLLWPLREHRLWRYRADRTSFGDGRFTLERGVGRLWLYWLPVLAGLWVGIGSQVYVRNQAPSVIAPAEAVTYLLAFALYGAGLAVLWVSWRAQSFAYLASGLRHASGARLVLTLASWRMVTVHLLGWLTVLTILAIGVLILAFGTGLAVVVAGLQADLEQIGAAPGYVLAGVALAIYVALFLMRGALRLVFVTLPVLRHAGARLRIEAAEGLVQVRAGPAQRMADADGFANLFDMGSAI